MCIKEIERWWQNDTFEYEIAESDSGGHDCCIKRKGGSYFGFFGEQLSTILRQNEWPQQILLFIVGWLKSNQRV